MERPYINYSKCNSCGACIDICPTGVFAKKGSKISVMNPNSCLQCKACEVSCPAKAIEVK